MSHPESRDEVVDGIRVEVKSFKRNLLVFKSIGCVVKVRSATERGRGRRVNADAIRITNTYYSRIEGTPFEVPSAAHRKECRNEDKCKLRHYAAGIGVKIRFPGGGATPRPVPGLLPLDGVVSRTEVQIGTRSLTFTTAKGPHPG